ncbi:MAG: VacJ family lipoprotein [Burkholderiales bacterium]|nr:VacJ family lipoprotein [Burkholderiales bacterium]
MTLALLLATAFAFGGCATIATTIKNARADPGDRLDPWENWNRKVFAFNEGLDARILRPLATGYAKVVPQFVRRSVDNVFNNMADAWSAVNNVLQGKGEPAFQDVVRVTTNSVFGFFGVLDIASEFGLDHHYEDFGQTLGRWGFGAGAYVVWPLLGPSSVRDSIALPLDRYYASPGMLISNGALQTGVTVLQIVNTRAKLLGVGQLLDEIALDKYTFVRDAYLQRRRSLVYGDDAPPAPDPTASAAAPADAVTPADTAASAVAPAAAAASGAAPK